MHVTTRSRSIRVLAGAAFGAVLAVLALGVPPVAMAADNGQWSVFPTTVAGQPARPFFQPLLTPGVPVADSFTITNKTDEPLNVDLYAADAFNTPEGGYASRPPQAPKRDMGAWIDLPSANVTVNPNSALDVPFTVNPPLDASPGDHAGSIVAVNTKASVSKSGSVNVRAIQAVGTRVYGRVAGPTTESIDVTSLELTTSGGVGALLGGPVDADVTYKVVNTGNVRLSPKAQLEISPLVGGSKHVKPLALPELLPRGSAVVHQHVSGIWPFGKLTAKVQIVSGASTETASSSTFVIPWALLAIVVVLLVLLWWWLRRRRQRDEGEIAWSEVDVVKAR
jgi:hypothetical protein